MKAKLMQLINENLEKFNQQVRLFSKRIIENNVELIFSTGLTIIEPKRNCKTLRALKESEYFLSNADELLSNDNEIRTKALLKRKRDAARKGGVAAMKNPQNHVCNRQKDSTPWNKGLFGVLEPWNKGRTKDDDERLMQISNKRKGEGNPMFGISPSLKTREKLSKKVKEKIENGTWTPNVHNSRTRKNIVFRGIKFRSSWEVIFYAATGFQYEKIRIRYPSEDGNYRIYITDFYDEHTNTIYEIKPRSKVKENEKKINFAISWCKANDYKFEIIDEHALRNMIKYEELPHDEIDEFTLIKIKKLYAINK